MQVLLVLAAAVALAMSARPTHPDPFIDAMLAAEHQRSRRSVLEQNDTVVCFGHEIGCFTWAETNFTGHFPEDPGQGMINTTFNLYSRGKHADNPTVMFYENETTYNDVPALKNTEKTLFVLAHGFGGSGRTFWVVHMKNALLKIMDANVLAVDWRRGSSLPLYNQAAVNTMSVGRATARLLAEFKRIYGYAPKKIHYLGFSLGAQVGGFAGRHYHKLTGEKFGRMTILDAAAPGFEKYGVHVTKDDSEFTVAVHTSAGDSIITGRVGIIARIGHIDFYPNGGVNQPGCRFYDIKCHHERAHHYFLEAVLNSPNPKACRFVGQHCEEEWELVTKDQCTLKSVEGELSLSPSGSGKLYIKTNSTSPFCIPVEEPNSVYSNVPLANFEWV